MADIRDSQRLPAFTVQLGYLLGEFTQVQLSLSLLSSQVIKTTESPLRHVEKIVQNDHGTVDMLLSQNRCWKFCARIVALCIICREAQHQGDPRQIFITITRQDRTHFRSCYRPDRVYELFIVVRIGDFYNSTCSGYPLQLFRKFIKTIQQVGITGIQIIVHLFFAHICDKKARQKPLGHINCLSRINQNFRLNSRIKRRIKPAAGSDTRTPLGKRLCKTSCTEHIRQCLLKLAASFGSQIGTKFLKTDQKAWIGHCGIPDTFDTGGIHFLVAYCLGKIGYPKSLPCTGGCHNQCINVRNVSGSCPDAKTGFIGW